MVHISSLNCDQSVLSKGVNRKLKMSNENIPSPELDGGTSSQDLLSIENPSSLFSSTTDRGISIRLTDDDKAERIEAFLEPMTEMFGTYFKPTEIANRLESLDDTARQRILNDSRGNSERGMRSLIERLCEMSGAPLLEFYRLITTMDNDTDYLPGYLLSGAGAMKQEDISRLMQTFIVELVDERKLEELTATELKTIVDEMVKKDLMKKPRKSVENIEDIMNLVRRSNPDWPWSLWRILQDSMPGSFLSELQEDDASMTSTECDENDPSLFDLTGTVANMSLPSLSSSPTSSPILLEKSDVSSTSPGSMQSLKSDPASSGLTDTAANSTSTSTSSSVRRSRTKSKKHDFQQLHIKVRDLPSINRIVKSGALKQAQVTTEENKKLKSVEDAWNNTRADFSDGDDEEDGEDTDEGTEVKVPYEGASSSDVKLNLRDYQKELAKPALEGKNTIICAPTGCGKTRVAMDIIIKHLNGQAGSKSKSRKVCFFARTIPLANQQYKTIRKHLPEKYKVNIFTGDSEFSSDMHLLLDDLDVVVLTPMILQNHISSRNVRDLRVFSLLVFDECHHTREKEPYNTLMASYVDRKVQGERDLPQVIGLTASFPVEKAKHESAAAESILQLCANLDAHLISVVTEHKAELEKLVPVPNESMEHLRERDDDESYKKIVDVMQKLEDDAHDCATDIGASGLSSTVSQCPSDNRKLQKYNNWTVDLWNAAVVHPRTSRETNLSVRHLMIIAQYLTKYHIALDTHDLVHLEDVMDYLDDCFAENRYDECQTSGETRLYGYFKDLKDYLRGFCHEENPNLRHLVKTIDEKLLKVSSSSRGIIFVRTRAIAEALVSWLNRNQLEGIRNLKASIFTGTNAKESQGGMTQAQQNALVEKFREGKVRLLVATSVAEEGMDVPECNLVIKYNHVGNEITTIQTRGRSRKYGGNSVLLAMANICEKETINKKRTELMYKGIEIVRKMDSEDFIDRVVRKQIDAKDKRELEELIESRNKMAYKDKKFTMICKLCRKFSIHSDSLRTLCRNHRVVVDRDVWDHKKVFISEKKMYLGEIQIVGSVRCDTEVENGKKCRGPLGTLVYYSANFFLAVGIKHFTINEENENKPRAVKQWKALPYPLKELESKDIKRYITLEKETETVSDAQETVPLGASHDMNKTKQEERSNASFVVQETEPSDDSYISSYGASVADCTGETMASEQLDEIAQRYQYPSSSSNAAASSSPSRYTSRGSHHETKPKLAMPELDSGVAGDFSSTQE